MAAQRARRALIGSGPTGSVYLSEWPERSDPVALKIFGPIFVLKLKFAPEGYERRLVAEVWLYPDNSMILGAPAKAVRATDDQMRAMIARGADVYVKRWKRYAAGLKRLG
jgi:hypothetical protein